MGLLRISLDLLNVEAKDGVRVLAQSADAAQQKDLRLGNFAGGESSEGNSHLDVQKCHLSAVNVEPLDRVEGAHFFIVSSEDENDGLLKEAAATLAACYVELDVVIYVPFVFFNTIVLTAPQLHFLGVLVATKGIDGLATVCAHSTKEGFLLQHSSLRQYIILEIL